MVAGTIGHFVEWYDWYIYGLLAAVFASQIFPSHSPFASLIAALLTYAIGFVIRPFSGIIISPLADRYGRRTVLTLWVSGMALGSLIIALTPGYATIGYAAPILFVVARIIQGISAGSEAQSAISFMVEHAPPNRRGLFGSFSNMASGLATLAATGSAAIVTATLSGADLAAWGWRIPFLVGGILGMVGLILRARADETPEFEASSAVDKKSAPARLLACFVTTRRRFCRRRRSPPRPWPTTPGRPSCPLTPSSPPAGTWPRPWPAASSGLLARDHRADLRCAFGPTRPPQDLPDHRCHRHDRALLPLLLLLNRPGFCVYVVVAASGWVVLGIWQAVYPTIQAELFPASVRVSGIGFAHQLVIAIFGGTAPLIAAAFVGAGHPMYVAIYMTIVVAVCLVVYFTLPETGDHGDRVTVAPVDDEVLEGEHLLLGSSSVSGEEKRFP